MYGVLVQFVALLALGTPACGQASARPGRASSFENLSRQAEDARSAKRLDEALTLYKRALELKPAWEEGWWNAGSIAYDLDRFPECASAFRRLTALKPDHAPAWTMKGICEYKLRDYNAALRSLNRVDRMRFEENPELSRAAGLHLALVLTKLGYFERALVMLFRLEHAQGRTPEIIAGAGIAALRKTWIPTEVPESDRDKVFKIGDAMATVLAGGPAKEAMEKFEIAVRDYPKEPEIHYRFGALLLQHDLDRGIEEMKTTLELDPGHVPALVALARSYLKRGEPQTALRYAQEAVRRGPKDFNTHVALGRVLLATGDLAGAVRELEWGVKLEPDSPTAHYSLAGAYDKAGRKAEAARERESFKRLRDSTAHQP